MLKHALDTLTGKKLQNYRLERLLGESQGESIFLARSTGGATTYLLHCLTRPSFETEQQRNSYLKRFQSLASRVAALQHPAIFPLLDYGIFQDIPYLVSPNKALRSLRRHLAICGPVKALTVDRYLEQIASALDYAHEHGVFHGRLTLDCIFVRLDGQLIIADFGVRALLELNAEGHLLTPGKGTYAPEQILGRPSSPSSDVYALGAVLYQLLTGKPVFAGNTTLEVAQQHLFAASLRSCSRAAIFRETWTACLFGPWPRNHSSATSR
jgi:serine/threonine protein kinase